MASLFLGLLSPALTFSWTAANNFISSGWVSAKPRVGLGTIDSKVQDNRKKLQSSWEKKLKLDNSGLYDGLQKDMS